MSVTPEEINRFAYELDVIQPVVHRAVDELNLMLDDGHFMPTITQLSNISVTEIQKLEHLREYAAGMEQRGCTHVHDELALFATLFYMIGRDAGQNGVHLHSQMGPL